MKLGKAFGVAVAILFSLKVLEFVLKTSQTGLTPKLAQNFRPLDIYRWGWGGSPAYPQRKENIMKKTR